MKGNLQVLYEDISKIKPYKHNAKTHTETQVQSVANSIREFGFIQPIVLDKDNTIVIGHCRYEAAKTLGMETVPCLYVDKLTKKQIQILRLADNKLNESEWDFDMLAGEMEKLPGTNFSDYGFSQFELSEILSPEESEEQALPTDNNTRQMSATTSTEAGRYIFIIRTKQEEEWFKRHFKIDGILNNNYRASELMKGENQ